MVNGEREIQFEVETHKITKLNQKQNNNDALKADLKNLKIRVIAGGFSHNLFLPLLGLVLVFVLSLAVELIFLLRYYGEAVRVSNLMSLYSNTLDMSNSIHLLDSSLASLFAFKSASSKANA